MIKRFESVKLCNKNRIKIKKIISAQVNWKTTKASFKKLLKTKLLFTPVKAVENKYSKIKIKIKRYDLNEYKLSVVMALP